jgi:hypothetical protein
MEAIMTLRFRVAVVVTCAAVVLGAGFAAAQIVVFDPAVTAKNAAIATVKEEVLSVLTDQGRKLRRMARRLSALTNLDKYSLIDPPAWRIHWFIDDGTFLYANPYNAALNYGDGEGTSFADVARRREPVGAALAQLTEEAPNALAAIEAELATLDIADSTIIAGTDQAGQLRYNGRREDDAIGAFDTNVVDPSSAQSATAVLDKISGAGLIRARQQQARIHFLVAIVEQLLVDNKRARDADAAAMNMQLGRLRHGRTAGLSLLAGAGDDLRRWKQP